MVSLTYCYIAILLHCPIATLLHSYIATFFNIFDIYSCLNILQENDETCNESFLGYFFPPDTNFRFTGCVSLCVCCMASTPTCSGGLPVSGPCRCRPVRGSSTAQGGTVDLPGMGEEGFRWLVHHCSHSNSLLKRLRTVHLVAPIIQYFKANKYM